MKNHRIVQLESLCKMKQSTIKKHVTKELESLGYHPKVEDGYVFAKGTHPVLLVAHMDTVHKSTVKKIKYEGNKMSSPQGIGGDDRCGIYIILKLIEEFNCSVLFTEDEEIGGVGAHKFVKSFDCNSIDINFIIEFDRRGYNDCVFYYCNNPDFEEFIESTGFWKTNIGSYSDISTIAPAIGCAAVNLSSGYHNEHTLNEYINTDEVVAIIEEAKILLSIESNFYEYIESKSFYDWGFYQDDYEEDSLDYYRKIYHVYLKSEEASFCCEVDALNEMEAKGIVLTKYPNLTVGNIVFILDDLEV